MRKLRARLLPLALGLLLAVICLPQTALAYAPIPDLSRKCSLTLTCKYEGVEYALYRVCDVDAAANFTPAGVFEELEATIERMIAERDWQELTSTLVNTLNGWEADGRGAAPYARSTSSEQGEAVFSDLPVGLYLVTGRQKEVAPGKYYIPTDFMVCLPNWEKADENGTASGGGEWKYDVAVVNKGAEKEGETTTLGALKVWRGDGSISRPVSVTVQLLRRERGSDAPYEVYETVTLNRQNNFDTIWSELDNSYEWTVREVDVPGDYDVSYSQQGATIVITNTYDPDIPQGDKDPDPPDKPDPPDNPNPPDKPGPPDDPNPPDKPGTPDDPNPPDTPDTPDTPDNPNPPDTPDTPDNPTPPDTPDGPPNIPGEEIEDPPTPLVSPPTEEIREPEEEDIDDPPTPLARLPQTGVLWWPVPFLVMGGLFLFVLGWALNRRKYEE